MTVGPPENPDEKRIENDDEYKGAEMPAKSMKETGEGVEIPQELIVKGKQILRDVDSVAMAQRRLKEIDVEEPAASPEKTQHLIVQRDTTELAQKALELQGYDDLEDADAGGISTVSLS
jgi:hypothetical protein